MHVTLTLPAEHLEALLVAAAFTPRTTLLCEATVAVHAAIAERRQRAAAEARVLAAWRREDEEIARQEEEESR